MEAFRILEAVRDLEEYYVVEMGVDPMVLTSFRADLLTLMMAGGAGLAEQLEVTRDVFDPGSMVVTEDEDGLTISLPTKRDA